MKKDYGEVTDYTDPEPDRYHGQLKRGDSSQAGILLAMMLRSLVESKKYDQDDWTHRMDEFFSKIDGDVPSSGPGGYTSQSIREAWRQRVQQKKPWGTETAGKSDTTEAVERTFALAVRYVDDPTAMAEGSPG